MVKNENAYAMKRMDSLLATAFCPFIKGSCREDCVMLSCHVHPDEDSVPRSMCLIAQMGDHYPYVAISLEETEVPVW